VPTVGDFVAGFGCLYRVSDIWWGKGDEDEQMVMLENITNDAWAFQWIPICDFNRHFEEGLDV
jgi:hypothetical protein